MAGPGYRSSSKTSSRRLSCCAALQAQLVMSDGTVDPEVAATLTGILARIAGVTLRDANGEGAVVLDGASDKENPSGHALYGTLTQMMAGEEVVKIQRGDVIRLDGGDPAKFVGAYAYEDVAVAVLLRPHQEVGPSKLCSSRHVKMPQKNAQ